MKTLTIFLFLTTSLFCSAQEYAFLEDISLENLEDLIAHEKEAIRAIDYLMSTPVDENNNNRKYCTRFVIRYAAKSPISIMIDDVVGKVYKGNNDILVMFMGLWIKSAINDKEQSNDYYQKYIYTQLSEYCSQGNGINQNKVIKKLIKAGKENDIDGFIAVMKD